MINIVKKYLELNHFSNQKEHFEDLFLSHPNYPSVFAITDSLDMLSIENVAIKVPKEQFVELPDSFLAIFNQDLVLVSKTSASIRLETDKGEKHNLSFNEFLTDWNEVIIAIETNEVAPSKRFEINQEWLKVLLPLTVLILLSVIYNNYDLKDFVFLITSLIGLLFSIFIIQEKLGIENQVVSKFCNIGDNTSCDSVIKSDESEINKWINFSDLPLLFFSVSTLSILLQPNYSSVIVGFLSVLAVPLIVYSIWLQKMKLKKWCVLCLAISFVLVMQGLVFSFIEQPTSEIDFSVFSTYLFSLIILASIWMGIKPILETKIKAEKEINGLKKFKRNYSVFNSLSNKIPVINGWNRLEGLRFGNSEADIKLTIIISPSCGHCHTAFQDALGLVSKFPKKVFLNVLFNVNPENNDNLYKVVVERLLAINNSNPDKVEEAISDWHIKKMGLESWKEKWEVDTIDMKVNDQIYQQYFWCLENEFNYTPIKIVNDKLFPNEYEISELKYFLNDFSEEKEVLENNSLVQA
ncbi:vitamin K epoxide reductase family protein [Flavobacterium sp.]|uniref:vitamin K epoxide reductase family protein n=1 Tax=Flavobacterium sp. TaxID=239 RepID=UPI002B4B0E8E|nr:vitamin K epoxide reductase family protein [Flavobacterium sp.]HLF50705.1 vitamin K epoxide reductase family protein [Flavobacterium sp.]